MSQKKFMHPRNIYKKEQSFKELAIKYPEFAKYVRTNLSGNVGLNFKDIDSVRAYSRVLLQKDFNLDVTIPPDTLVPTIPLRLNYILWLEDLLSYANISDNIVGIDIGTGATCVYPLMIARKNNWRMVATEIDDNNAKYAQENVNKNELNHMITVKPVKGDTLLKEILDENAEVYDFCMCNPPFFGSIHELSSINKARNLSRPKPKNAFCASTVEVVTDGGEIGFIDRLIKESTCYKERIKIYTTMVGVKTSLKPLKKSLRDAGVSSYKQSEFYQGHTTRWGLTWTFTTINLYRVPDYSWKNKKKQKKAFSHVFTPCNTNIIDIDMKMQEIFTQLEMDTLILRKSATFISYNVTAYSNTWSHSRRKRREQERVQAIFSTLKVDKELQQSDCKSEEASSTISTDETPSEDKKHKDVDFTIDIDIDESASSNKRMLEEEENEIHDSKKIKTGHSKIMNEKYLEFTAFMKIENEELNIELAWITGTCAIDSLHQVLQYIKNNLKFETVSNVKLESELEIKDANVEACSNVNIESATDVKNESDN